MPLSLAKTRWSGCIQGKDEFRATLNKSVVRTPLSSDRTPSSRGFLQKVQEIVFLAHALLQNSEYLFEARLHTEERFDVHTCTREVSVKVMFEKDISTSHFAQDPPSYKDAQCFFLVVTINTRGALANVSCRSQKTMSELKYFSVEAALQTSCKNVRSSLV